MTSLAIVQARMGSSRLPGKVLFRLGEATVLDYVLHRVLDSESIRTVVVATTNRPEDDAIVSHLVGRGAPSFLCYRGATDDVLSRFIGCLGFADGCFGEHLRHDTVVRITADCPLIDPRIIDACVVGFYAGNWDAYGLGGEFPDGLDVMVYGRRALELAHEKATLASDREHVGPWIERNCRVGWFRPFDGLGLGHHRWTLDEPADYEFLLALEAGMPNLRDASWKQIAAWLAEHPEVVRINAGIPRNEGYAISLAKDR